MAYVPEDWINDTSASVQVMAWCHQAPSHNLNRCWPTSMKRRNDTMSGILNRHSWVPIIMDNDSCACCSLENLSQPNWLSFVDPFCAPLRTWMPLGCFNSISCDGIIFNPLRLGHTIWHEGAWPTLVQIMFVAFHCQTFTWTMLI